MEMVAVYEGMTLTGKLDLLLCLVLDKGASIASEVEGLRYKKGLHLIRLRESCTRDFLGKG